MKRNTVLIGAAALCGFAWGHDGFAWLLGLAAVVPLLWHEARTRWVAGALALAFYLAASRGLPFGAGIFFAASAPAWLGWSVWFAAGLINAVPWLVLWSKDARRRLWFLPLILILTALPPLGVVGWSNPLTAAGVFFPGMGFVGLVFFVALVVASMAKRWPAVAMLAGAAMLANISASMWPPASAVENSWSGVDTHFGKLATGSADFLAAYSRLEAIKDMAEGLAPGHVLVLPETLLGRFTGITEFALADTSRQLQAKGSTILVGGELPAGERGQAMKNALVAIGAGQGTQLVQRVPVPIGMWKPWAADTVIADPLGNGIGLIGGRKVAYLVCYEQLLVFPVLASMVHRPDVMVGAANDWWARETSIPAIQAQALDLWGRLFAVRVVRATNI